MYICITKENNMTTQKVTSTLNAAGFKAFRVYAEKVNGVYTNFRTGDFKSFKLGNIIGVETYGIKTSEMIAALVAAGINAKETVTGNGMIKIA